MYKYLLQSVDGIALFGIATLLLFFSTFCLAIIRVFFLKKETVEHIAGLPLED